MWSTFDHDIPHRIHIKTYKSRYIRFTDDYYHDISDPYHITPLSYHFTFISHNTVSTSRTSHPHPISHPYSTLHSYHVTSLSYHLHNISYVHYAHDNYILPRHITITRSHIMEHPYYVIRHLHHTTPHLYNIHVTKVEALCRSFDFWSLFSLCGGSELPYIRTQC